MSEERATLEVIAPTIEEAIEKGLGDLGLTENEVEVEILDEGKRGLFGIGGRQVRVRLTVKEIDETSNEIKISESVEEPEPFFELEVSDDLPEDTVMEMESDNSLVIARETVSELLGKMKVKADVVARFGEVDESGSRPPIIVDIHGKDLSILIGRRAETLNALQFITRLIVGKELGRSVYMTVDVEGYRVRRERSLRNLAQRMATQAVKAGRRQTLEPMPPAERRIIHIELRDNKEVITESVGEDPKRKVTIIPVD
jgi:spoIIIJ-associated protein